MLENPEPREPQPVWGTADFVVFAVFFLGTAVFFLPAALYVLRFFRPGLRFSDLTAVHQIVLQALMDLVLVAFIMFLVKVVRGRSFLETINWNRQYQFSIGSLIVRGIALAAMVMAASVLLPQTGQTPIEKLISSMRSLYVFTFFGVAVAPLLEEIIFRGFLFKVFADMSGPGAAALLTAFLFALLHAVQLWGNWGAVALIFLVGYFLAIMRLRSGSIITSWVIHASYNATLFGVYAVGLFFQKVAK